MKPTVATYSYAKQGHRVALVSMVLIAALPAVLALSLGFVTETQRARASASATAWVFEQAGAVSRADVNVAPALGELAALANLPGVHTEGEARKIFAADGRSIASGGEATARAWPGVSASRELMRNGVVIGQVQIVRSLRPALAWAGLFALAGGALGLVLWSWVFTHPIAVMRKAEGRWRGMARQDVLTGLYNLDGLRSRVHRALVRREDSGQAVALLVLNLDRFSIVNESMGHAFGDALLRSVAQRLRAITRSSAVVARLGADQFAILLEGIGGTEATGAASSLARNLLRALAPSHVLRGTDTVIALSIGVAVASDETDSADALLWCADKAMRKAKSTGGASFRVYDASMGTKRQHLLELEQGLRQAQQKEQFFLAYQPIMDSSGKVIKGVEALLRWADPQRGTMSPADFIPVLEETGLIVRVGRWVLTQACRNAADWRAAGGKEILMSVNVSPRQFDQPDFIQMVDQVLAETGFPARLLQLEVTEGLLLDTSADCLAKIEALTQLGVLLAIDDFGMGYSSLAYLKRFKLHALKIDKMFVQDIASEPQDKAIVRAIIDLGHGLGMRVTAEGVETEAQFLELSRLGCDTLQGFLFARPMPESELRNRLALPGASAQILPHALSGVPAVAASHLE